MNRKYSCPKCTTKIPFENIFVFKGSQITVCKNCNAELEPIYKMSWKWGYFIGSLSVVLPAELILYFYDDIYLAFFTAFFSASTAIICIVIHTYITTEFKRID